jgi:hypothetical protein
MVSHDILNNFYVVLLSIFDTSLNKTAIKLSSILIFARPFPNGDAPFQNPKPHP